MTKARDNAKRNKRREMWSQLFCAVCGRFVFSGGCPKCTGDTK